MKPTIRTCFLAPAAAGGSLVLAVGALAVPAQPAPAGVAVQALNAGVQMNWTPADGATSYSVYQGTSAGGEASTPVLTGIAASGVTVSGLQNDTQYFFRVSASGNGGESAKSVEVRAIPFLPIADAPTFSVGGGGYTSVQHVKISDTLAGATIYYTVDGSLPTKSSPQYSSPVTVDTSMVLRAIAVASGHSDSGVTSAAYTLDLPPAVAVPVFSILGGTFSNTQYVDITDGTKGASIFYTTDGSDPTADSAPYTGTIQIKATTTLKAIATANNYSDSPIASATYTIKSPSSASGGAIGWEVLCGLCTMLLLRHRKFAMQRTRR